MNAPKLPAPYNSLDLSVQVRDTFDGDGPVDPSLWAFDTLDDGLNRAGNQGRRHMRHAACYLAPDELGGNDAMAYREDGLLHMRGLAVETPNPHRENFLSGPEPEEGEPDTRVLHRYGDYMLYDPWLTTALRKWSNDEDRHVTDPASPGHLFTKGSAFFIRLSFERMRVGGHRFSLWPMPWIPNEGDAYNGEPFTGVELDALEYDPALPYHLSCCAIAGGELGTTPKQLVDLRKYGVDLTVGFHEIWLLWLEDRLVWFCDGHLIQLDTERAPDGDAVLHMTRERNSGVRRKGSRLYTPHCVRACSPLRPKDPGLYPPASAILGVDRPEEDVTLIDEVAVYRVAGNAPTLPGGEEAAPEPTLPGGEEAAPEPTLPGGEEAAPEPARGLSVAEVASGFKRAAGWARWLANAPEGTESGMTPEAAESVRAANAQISDAVAAADALPVTVTVTVG